MSKNTKCALPSADSAREALDGKKGGVGKLVLSTGLRSVLIAPAFLLVGVKPAKAAVGSLLASTFISTFIVAYMAAKRQKRR